MVDEPKSGYWPPMGGVTLKVETKEKEKKVEEKKTIAVEIEKIARRYDPNSILMTRKRGDNYEYLLRFTTSIKESDFNKAGVEIAQLLKDKKVDATIHTEYQGKSVNIISPISFVENYEIMRATAALEGIQISSQTAPPEIKEDLNNLVKASTETLKAIEEGKVGKKDAKEWEGIASTWKKVKVKFATWLIADELESYWKMFYTLSQTVQELIKEKETDKETIKKMQEAQEEMKSKLNTIETNINERIAQLDKEIEDQKKKIEQLKKGKKKVDLNTKKIIDNMNEEMKRLKEENERLKKLLTPQPPTYTPASEEIKETLDDVLSRYSIDKKTGKVILSKSDRKELGNLDWFYSTIKDIPPGGARSVLLKPELLEQLPASIKKNCYFEVTLAKQPKATIIVIATDRTLFVFKSEEQITKNQKQITK